MNLALFNKRAPARAGELTVGGVLQGPGFNEGVTERPGSNGMSIFCGLDKVTH